MATEQNMASAAEWEDIPAEKFEIIGTDDFSGDIIARPKIGYWADAWRRLKENRAGCADCIDSFDYYGLYRTCNFRLQL